MNNTINSKFKKRRKFFEYTYSPVHQVLPKGAVFLGYLLRAVIVVTAVTGLLLFIADAFRFDIAGSSLFLIALSTTFIFAVMCVSVTTFLVTSGLIAVAILAATLTVDNFLGYIIASIQTMWNGMMTRLGNAGYQTIGLVNFYHGDLEISESTLLFIAMVMVGTVLSLFFSLCIMRKTRLTLILIVGTLICSSIFTYNISSSNTGFALLLTVLCAVITMKFYDSVYAGKNTENSHSLKYIATGGYAGFAALVIALLLIVIPANSINKRWIEIEFINDKLEYARAVVASVIIGDTPNTSDLGFVGNMDTLNTRSTKAEERSFTGKTMMVVQAAFNTPIYLRSWTGTYYANDSWYSAYKDDVDKYKSSFPKDFMPEEIMYNFLHGVNPKLTNFNVNSLSYGNHIEDGFVTTPVDISNVKSTGNLLYVPGIINPTLDLLKYGTREYEPYASEWENYYEGIITTSWFNFNKTYRAIAFVPIYRNPDYTARLYNNRTYYQMSLQFIRDYGNSNLSAQAQQEYIDSLKSFLDSREIMYTEPTLLERFFEMNNIEKQKFLYDNITLPELYASFVRDNYTYVPEEDLFEVLYPIASEISQKVPARGEHETVLAVVDYLSDNYTYTLAPTPPTSRHSSALRAFLTETKEGYCVQFATAATMILRTLGLPTRYVEGYVAAGFRRNEAPEKTGNFITEVHDFDAHAWIEVYIDGVGWMQYEATPQYYIEMYAPYEPLRTSQNTGMSGSDPMPEIMPEETDISGITPNNGDGERVVISVSIIVGAIAVAVLILLIIRWYGKSRKAIQKRYDTIDKASKSSYDDNTMRGLAKSLNDYIMQIYAIEGCIPDKGELPADYARRISIAMKDEDFDKIMTYIEKEEFGHGVTREELKKLARYLRQLWENIYYKQNLPKRLWLRHFKRVI